MNDITKLPHRFDRAAMTCRAVVETSKGRRSKFDYDPKSGLFELRGLLPEGMTFPMDFGFFPSTLGEDGDPLDVQVLHDEPIPVGVMLDVRLIGVIEADQTEEDNTVRNDRLIAVADASQLYARITDVKQLDPKYLDHLTQFWVNYNALKGKTFAVRAVHGPEAAADALEAATKAAKQRS